mmetsp:Transcript_18161/g.26955  ORF Transcript_18161/g.26955 Transcript_18161/m.26955 type:complete len:609 (+) Transcript_18161:76-1902(+)
MFSKIVLCLFFTGAALSAPMTSAANLRSSKVGFPRNLSTASECTIMVASDIRILEGVSEHLEEDSFECEMAAEDMDMESGQMLRLRVNQGQLAQLKKMLKDGDLIPGESKLVHGANVKFNSDGLFVPPGLDIATNVRKNVNKKRRRLAKTLGTKPILVVKVTDNGGLTRAESPAVIGDDIFGTLGDPVNLASQMKACSFGKLNIVPGAIHSSKKAAPGVIKVRISKSLTSNDRYAIHNAVTSAVNAKLGISLPGPYEQVMYVVEKCYVNCGYAAYAYINSWMSVYVDRYYKQVGVQMHELGHSFNLAHSGGLNGLTYTDHTGLMGNPLYSDDIGKMCFNAAKNWQLNWYNDKKLLVNPLINPTTIVDLVGIANYDTTANSHPVVVKIETGTSTDQFIGFNRAVGINAQNDEADNEVTIVQTGNNGENYSQSQLKAHLIQGESYTFQNWDNVHDLIITALDIDLGANQAVDIAVARVSITLEGANPCGVDSSSFTFKNDNGFEQDCAWLTKNADNSANRIAKYCEYGSVKWACQATCDSCAGTCADSSTFAFTLNSGKTKNCAYLLQSSDDAIDLKRTEKYCNRGAETAPTAGFEVGAACPESCGFCPV